jgi:hypothetical protein
MKDWLKQLLTKILGNGFLVLLIVAVFYILYLRECKRPAPCPAEDELIVKKKDWQSMIDAANKPPTIHIDTVTGPTVYVPTGNDNPPPDPKPEPKDSTINNYSDSLVKKDVHVHYDFKVKGTLLDRSWSYNPIKIHEIDSIPYPVYVKGDPYEVKIPQRGFYIYGIAGGNMNTFIPGAGVDYITKKNTEIGYLYQRYGNENFHSFKLGIKLFKNK